jgi:glycosyltransferase involved in cell wall biosynthesis
MMTPKLVTIGLPMWKRLEYLPHILKIVEAQDYPAIELLVSDNGMNGNKVRDVVAANYSRPFTFRQNPHIAEITEHFNQIVAAAAGQYFVLLSDDDEITPNFVSELVGLLERYPEASIAFARQEIINEEGVVSRTSKEVPVEIMSGADFIRGTWKDYQLGFEALGTNVARTSAIRACGGYPDFTRGSAIDNALIIKLCLNSHVLFGRHCAWRWRVYESSHGWSVSIQDLAASSREFMRFLETDPVIQELARVNPAEWQELKGALIHNEWKTYLWRWRDIYKERLPYIEWVRAAFAMPFMPSYYRNVASVFRAEIKARAMKSLGLRPPAADEAGYFGRN